MMMFEGPRVRAGGVFVAGLLIGAAIGNYDVTSKSVEHVSDQYGQAKKQLQSVQKALPGLTAAEACEHARAEIAAHLALQTQMVKPEELPPDCPHPNIATK